MVKVAEFWINETNVEEQELKLVKNKTMWYGGRTDTPLDTPPCGFDDELCQKRDDSDSTFTLLFTPWSSDTTKC